eukprot:2656255-Prorocentrum_lima.AAC.1
MATMRPTSLSSGSLVNIPDGRASLRARRRSHHAKKRSHPAERSYLAEKSYPAEKSHAETECPVDGSRETP